MRRPRPVRPGGSEAPCLSCSTSTGVAKIRVLRARGGARRAARARRHAGRPHRAGRGRGRRRRRARAAALLEDLEGQRGGARATPRSWSTTRTAGRSTASTGEGLEEVWARVSAVRLPDAYADGRRSSPSARSATSPAKVFVPARPRRPPDRRRGAPARRASASSTPATPSACTPASRPRTTRIGVARRARRCRRERHLPRPHLLGARTSIKPRYDVVIIGGGAHGLGTAYYLAKNYGVTNVAVLEMNYIGAGGSGRNTTIIRSNYRTPEGIRFYERSMQLYAGLGAEVDFNLMLSRHGHFTLAHTDSSVRVQRERAEMNQALGVDSRLIFRDEIAELCPRAEPVARTCRIRSRRRSTTRRARCCATTRWCGATPRAPPSAACTSTRACEVTGIRKDANGKLHRRRHQRGADRRRRRHLRRRRLDDADHRHGRHPHADHEPRAAGVRDRAGQADAAQDRRLGRTCTCTSRRPTAASS